MSTSRVIIVGGGPAGCAAAYTLAKNSIDVTILERGQPKKDKACGDALIPSAFELMSMFGIDQKRLETLGGYRCSRVDMYIYGLCVRQAKYDANPIWIIPRAIIDQEIRNIIARRVLFRYKTDVKDIIIESNRNLKVLLVNENNKDEQITCNTIIIASGSMNRLSKKFGIDGRPHVVFAISMYTEIIHNGTLKFQFVNPCKPGYRWIFPISEKITNAGVCVLTNKPKANLRLLGEELLKDHNAKPIGRWRGGWGPIWSGLGQCWHHKCGIISCGDSAGLVNPYNGEGITAALRSGKKAGELISDYLLGYYNITKLYEYTRWIKEYFSERYNLTPFQQIWTDLCGTYK